MRYECGRRIYYAHSHLEAIEYILDNVHCMKNLQITHIFTRFIKAF